MQTIIRCKYSVLIWAAERVRNNIRDHENGGLLKHKGCDIRTEGNSYSNENGCGSYFNLR